MSALYDCNAGPRVPSRTARALPKVAEKLLDCPGLVDDYYLNLLDWSSTNVVRPLARTDLLQQRAPLNPCTSNTDRQSSPQDAIVITARVSSPCSCFLDACELGFAVR